MRQGTAAICKQNLRERYVKCSRLWSQKERRDPRHRFAYVLPVLLFMPPRGVGILLPTDGERSFMPVGPDRLRGAPTGLPENLGWGRRVFEFRQRRKQALLQDTPRSQCTLVHACGAECTTTGSPGECGDVSPTQNIHTSLESQLPMVFFTKGTPVGVRMLEESCLMLWRGKQTPPCCLSIICVKPTMEAVPATGCIGRLLFKDWARLRFMRQPSLPMRCTFQAYGERKEGRRSKRNQVFHTDNEIKQAGGREEMQHVRCWNKEPCWMKPKGHPA